MIFFQDKQDMRGKTLMVMQSLDFTVGLNKKKKTERKAQTEIQTKQQKETG